MACGSILLKTAVSELVNIKLIHRFVEDFQIASSIQSLVEETQHNDTAVRDMATDASRCPDDVRMSGGRQTSIDMLLMKQGTWSYMHVQNLINSL